MIEMDVAVCYDATLSFKLEFVQLGKRVDHAVADGRLAVAVGGPAQFERVVGGAGGAVHTLLVLHTPGKTSVSVVILSDPDESEVFVVNDDGFTDLSRVDEEAHAALWKATEEVKS